MNWYMEVLKKYTEFSGRSRRTEYWMFTLFNIIISIVLSVVDGIVGTLGILSMLYFLAILIPSLAVSIRRLHDTDRSGWWLLVGLVPFIGAIILLVFMVQDSKPSENQYGANPKGATA